MTRTKKRKKALSPIMIVGIILLSLGLLVVLSGFIVSKFDLHSFCTIHYEKNVYELPNDFSSVSINTKNASISVLPSGDDVCRLECDEAKSVYYRIAVENGKLSVSPEDTRAWYEKVVSISFKSPVVRLYLPAKEYGELVLTSGSNNINVNLAHSFTQITLSGRSGDIVCHANAKNAILASTTSGDIKIYDSTATSCEARTTSGKLSLWGIQATSSVNVSAQSGDIRLSAINAKSATATATKGKITVIDTSPTQALTVKTTSGKVILRRVDAPAISVTTDTGKVTGTLLSDKRFDVTSLHGSVRVPASRGEETCTVRTTRGSVQLEIES